MALHLRLIPDDVRPAVGKDIGDLRLLHVHRNVDEHGTRTAAGGDVECLVENGGNISRLLDNVAVFGEGGGGASDVRLLKDVRDSESLRT